MTLFHNRTSLYQICLNVCFIPLFPLQSACAWSAHQDHRSSWSHRRCVQEEVNPSAFLCFNKTPQFTKICLPGLHSSCKNNGVYLRCGVTTLRLSVFSIIGNFSQTTVYFTLGQSKECTFYFVWFTFTMRLDNMTRLQQRFACGVTSSNERRAVRRKKKHEEEENSGRWLTRSTNVNPSPSAELFINKP